MIDLDSVLTSPSGWYGLHAETPSEAGEVAGVVVHLCPRGLLVPVWEDVVERHPKLKSLADRGHLTPHIVHEVKENAAFDLGGMLMIGTPFVSVPIADDGRSIDVLTTQVADALIAARKNREYAKQNGRRFVKLYGCYVIVVLRADEADRFERELTALLPEAERRLDAFMAARRAAGKPSNRQELADHLKAAGAHVYMPEMDGPPKGKA